MKSHLKRCLSNFLEGPRHRVEAIQEYITNGGDIDKVYRGTTALCEAARAGAVQAVTDILEAGAQVNLTDNRGCTPLYLAASHGHGSCLQLLLAADADPDIPSHTNYSALASAIQNNHDTCAEILIEAGATVNVLRPNTLGVDISLLSYVLFAKENLRLAEKLIVAGTLPHRFEPPLGFILLDDPINSTRIIPMLIAAGFKIYHENWVQVMKRKGEQVTDKQRNLVQLLESDHKNVASLQRLCRFTIRTTIVISNTKGHIKTRIYSLPIPCEVKKYLAMEYL